MPGQRLPFWWRGREYHQHHKSSRSLIAQRVLDARRGYRQVANMEGAGLVADAKFRFALQNVIQLILAFVDVGGMLLARLKTVETRRQPLTANQICLAHFFGPKLCVPKGVGNHHNLHCCTGLIGD